LKLPDLDYIRPKTLKEAIDLLVAYDGEAKLIAGGQSLMPMLAFRLLAPKILIDVSRLPGLNQIEVTSGGIRLGALATWRDIERHAELKIAHPLLAAAISHVAHYQIRNRGTVGGSLAHCDPASEFPALVTTCNADVVIVGPEGERLVKGADFILGAMTTGLATDEMIIQIQFPAWPKARRWGFEEFARRRGDFAMAAAAVFYDLDSGQRVVNPHIGIIGEAERAIRLTQVEDFVAGQVIDRQLAAKARSIGEQTAQPSDDIHAPAKYRKALIGVMIERALASSAGIQLATTAA
jgi:carbon-monoxide dehydrogenase medium subunit